MPLILLTCIVGLCFYAVTLQSTFLQDDLASRVKLQQQPQTPPKRSQHDASSRFSIMWKWGKLYKEDDQSAGPPQSHHLTIDTLSIGSMTNLGLLEAQSRTWGSHHSIRHYFAATEFDDADPSCYKTLNKTTIKQIVNTCQNDHPQAKGTMHVQYEKFSTGYHFRGVPSAGWICAQQRLAVALETLGKFYRREMEGVANFTLPDYLLMQDDDTYYNMVLIDAFLKDKDPNVPLAEAPCLIRHTKLQNLSFPWGGTILNEC